MAWKKGEAVTETVVVAVNEESTYRYHHREGREQVIEK